MVIFITLTTAGAATGPFDLYSNADGYSAAFETGVSKAALLAGYTTLLAPPATTIVRIKSSGTCTNQIDVPIVPCSSTTTTSSSSTSTTTSSSTSSTTSTSTTTTTTTAAPVMYVYEAEERYCASCGLNSGNVTVFSYSPLTLFDFAVAATTPIPVVLTYKIISTSVNIPTIQVVPAGATCLDACNYNPLPPE